MNQYISYKNLLKTFTLYKLYQNYVDTMQNTEKSNVVLFSLHFIKHNVIYCPVIINIHIRIIKSTEFCDLILDQ